MVKDCDAGPDRQVQVCTGEPENEAQVMYVEEVDAPEDLIVCHNDVGWTDDGKVKVCEKKHSKDVGKIRDYYRQKMKDVNMNKRKYAEKETDNENYESEDFGALMLIEKVQSGCGDQDEKDIVDGSDIVICQKKPWWELDRRDKTMVEDNVDGERTNIKKDMVSRK